MSELKFISPALLLVSIVCLCSSAYSQNTKALGLSIQYDFYHEADAITKHDVLFKATVANHSQKDIDMANLGSDHGIQIYSLDKDMKKSLVYPINPSYFYRGIVHIPAGKSITFTVIIDSKLLSDKKLILSIREAKLGDKEVFSEPFSFPEVK